MNTIVAEATPSGIGGVKIVRISGKDALKIADKILLYKFELKEREIKNCIVDLGVIKDKGLVVYFKGPKSFTGEDIVELHLHGNYFLVQKVIKKIIELGARMAEPGEFTKRAFLNGRIDLTQAEAVFDIINAKSDFQIKLAFNSLEGNANEKIIELQNKITSIVAQMAATIDYPEEDLEEITIERVKKDVFILLEDLEKIEKNYIETRIYREGVRVAIVGKPNVGKSSLLNRLVGFDRAIVDSSAGTTRDTIEQSFIYKGIEFIFVDTAGIREGKGKVEKEGIKRSLDVIKTADIVLEIVDSVQEQKNGGFAANKNTDKIFVYNKIDLLKNKNFIASAPHLFISCKTGENIELLKEKIYKRAARGERKTESTINNIRQYNCIIRAKEHLARVKETKEKNCEMLLSDLLLASKELAAITGEVAEEAAVNEIFSKFCVGK